MHLIVLPEVVAQTPGPGGGMSSLLIMGLMMAAMWFLLIAPQMKRQKEQKKMIEALKPGDEIITSGGIYGKIQQARADRLVVQIADNTRVEIGRSFVQMKVDGQDSKAQK